MNRPFAKTALFCLAAGLGGVASAAPVTYDFTALVTYDAIDATSTKGDTVSGYFVLNPGAASSSSNNLNYTGSNASPSQQVFDFYLTLPSSTFTTANITNGYDVISGIDNPTAGWTFAAQQGNGNITSELDFGPLSNLTPGAGPYDVNGYLTNQANAIANNAATGFVTLNNNVLDFKFETVSTVPLPPALPLLLGGMGLMALVARRRTMPF